MAGEFVIGNMVAKLAADTADFIKDMTGASNTAKQFKKDAGAIDEGGKKISGAFGVMGTAIKGFLTGAALYEVGERMVGFLKDSVVEAEAAAKAQAQLEEVIKSTGGAAGMTAQDVNDMATEMMGLTGIEDDLIVKNSALMLTFTKVGEEVFPQAMQAAADMSAVIGQDLQSSVTQLGKALNDPIQGVSALQRVGVVFSEEQKDVIKSLMETGKVAEAQGVILQELQTEFGGAAKAMHEAGTGSDDLKNSFGNLKEEIGKGLMPAVQGATSGLDDLIKQVTFGVSAENALVEAARRGIITQTEANEMTNRFTWTSMTAADAMEWLKGRVDEYNLEQEIMQGWVVSSQSALVGYTGAVENTAEATEGVVEANKAAEQTTKDWMSELDTGIENTIKNWMNELAFAAAGGGQIQAAAEAVKEAILAKRITPEEGTAYFNELYVAAEALKVDMGEITADEAAQNIRDTLGGSLKEAKALIEEVRRKGQFSITSTITVKVKYIQTGGPGTGHDFGAINNAAGGPIGANQLSWVGEKGPELFLPDTAGKIIPNSQVGSYQGGGGDVYEGDTYIEINNNNQQAAALSMAMLMNSRASRLSASMG